MLYFPHGDCSKPNAPLRNSFTNEMKYFPYVLKFSIVRLAWSFSRPSAFCCVLFLFFLAVPLLFSVVLSSKFFHIHIKYILTGINISMFGIYLRVRMCNSPGILFNVIIVPFNVCFNCCLKDILRLKKFETKESVNWIK